MKKIFILASLVFLQACSECELVGTNCNNSLQGTTNTVNDYKSKEIIKIKKESRLDKIRKETKSRSDNIHKVEEGMTEKQVKNLLGKPHGLIKKGSSKAYCYWNFYNYYRVYFQKGKVSGYGYSKTKC